MSLAITELELTDNNIISIPTDVISMLSLLIVFALIGYFFHNFIEKQTNKFVHKVDDNSNLELVREKIDDQLILQSTIVNHEKLEQPKIKRLNFLPLSKLLGIGSLAVVAIGGSNLLRNLNIQNSYKGLHNSQVNIKTENESAKSLLSMAKIKSSNQSQMKIKKISYVDPILSTNNSSKNNNFYQIKEIKTADFFSF
ncbi:hypothetical protein [Prochlorococcus marinus]|uniref:hypothetical protein n=1 Tax=Prochlorococcus marinus TaxID=1219 RepID=UPI0022B51AB5|nr:hypothetical protein [Prochlorococcus marinus]